MQLDTPKKIKDWMSERIMPRERPDRSVWLTQIGVGLHLSDIDTFMGTHGVSCNDKFWLGDEPNNRFWFEWLS